MLVVLTPMPLPATRSFERSPSPDRKEPRVPSVRGLSTLKEAGQVHGCVSQASTQRTSPAEQPVAHSA